MIRSKIAQLPTISQENTAQAKQRMLNRLCEQTLYRMCGILGKAPPNSILQAAVLDTVFLEVDDGLEDGSRFHIFGNKASQYVISMRVRPKPCSVEISAFS